MALQPETSGIDGELLDAPRVSGEGTEFLVLRNYDWEKTYEIDVVLTGTDGRTFEPRTFELGSGQVLTVLEELSEGSYRVRVSICGDEDETDVNFRGDPSAFGLVEVGNGIVSITADWP
jgi:hypothetical protein